MTKPKPKPSKKRSGAAELKHIEKIHRQSMRLCDQANALYRQAYLLEKHAALSLINRTDMEPSRSILFKSAAALAQQLGFSHEADILMRSVNQSSWSNTAESEARKAGLIE